MEKENLPGSVLPRWENAAAELEGSGNGSGNMVLLGMWRGAAGGKEPRRRELMRHGDSIVAEGTVIAQKKKVF